MSAGCHWQWASVTRRDGAKLMILALAGAFVFAGSPQLHERVHHSSARPSHACSITLRNAGNCLKAVEQPARAMVVVSPVASLPQHPNTISVWVPKLFLESCRYAHAPPRLTSNASVQVSGLLA